MFIASLYSEQNKSEENLQDLLHKFNFNLVTKVLNYSS